MLRKHLQWSLVLAALFLPRGEAIAAHIALDNFSYSQSAAERAWKPSSTSPRVVAGREGLDLPCPFKTDIPRVYWDRTLSLDLSRHTSFEIELSCDRPKALRSLNIYLKSGNGWYIGNVPIPESGRQEVRLLKKDFAVEGKPAGWHRIEALRLSAWRGVPEDTAVTLYSLKAREDSILLVQNTLSTESSAERSFATRVNQRVSRWLKNLNIPHGLITDDDVIRGALSSAHVALLCYNPHPPARELQALRRFVEAGGKLIVFYGADPGLAELMQVRLQSYKKSDLPGQWSSFSFADPGEWGVPQRVYQDSPNILPVLPANPGARVVAYWENAEGKRTPDPAWVYSESGLWMTHVLLDDDAPRKQSMLLGLLGRYEPSIWADAAGACISRVGKIDSFRNYAETANAIGAAVDDAANPERVQQLLTRAGRLYRSALSTYEQGQYRQVIDQCGELREVLVEAYGRVQRPAAGEFRGVWDHNGTGWFRGDWERTCRELAAQGINAVFPNVLWAGLAHYPSEVYPESYTFRRFGDQLAQCATAAHKNGLEVHAWKVCWNLTAAPPDFVARMRKEGRLQAAADGRTLNWLSPSHPKNIEMELASLREIARKYPVDGIHLDYIRYPASDADFSPASRAAFERWLGRKAGGWPQAARPGGALHAKFCRWRADQITGFVRRAREEIRAINPKIKLSAAVYGQYPDCAGSIGQDWGAWLGKGLVDFVCPMNYTTDPTRFATLAHEQLRLPNAKGRVYPGLGVTADESQLTPDQVIEQIASARRLGASGFMLFSLTPTLREQTLPALRAGLTAD